MQNDKLRLDYLLSLGLKLVDGDTLQNASGVRKIEDSEDVIGFNVSSKQDSNIFIESFSTRKNTGEQPCGDDVPVIACGDNGCSIYPVAENIDWTGEGSWSPKTWKPDLEALIKMQAEHDAKQVVKATDFGAIVDMKPKRTKVEFVKVEFDKFSKCAELFETESVYFRPSRACNVYNNIEKLKTLVKFFEQGNLYRKVEREATWQDELAEYVKKESIQMAMPFSEKAQFFNMGNVEESKFIAMCHIVASMTDKPN